MGTVCSCDGVCVNTVVASEVEVGENNELIATYWHPDDPTISETVIGCDRAQGEAMARVLSAIASVALSPTQP